MTAGNRVQPFVRHAAIFACYVIVCGIMVAPICNLAHLAPAMAAIRV